MPYCESCDSKVNKLMNYCPTCSEELEWTSATDNYCDTCGAPVSAKFNFCYACGEDLSPDEWLDDVTMAKGFKLEHKCRNRSCHGLIQEYMSYCPSCGDEQIWKGFYEKKDIFYCDHCGVNIKGDWDYCPFCGEDIIWQELKIIKDLSDLVAKVINYIEKLGRKAVILPVKRSIQFESYSCGIQCAFSILNYYGKIESLDEIRNYYWSNALGGLDTPVMKELFNEFGCKLIARRVFKIETIKEYIDNDYPMLVSVDKEQHWVVIIGYEEYEGEITHLYMMNPSTYNPLVKIKWWEDIQNLLARWPVRDFHRRWDHGWIGIAEEKSRGSFINNGKK